MNKAKEEILTVLRNSNDFVSGQQLCEKLKISRAAVSKHVKGLRKLGYQIESTPRRGHRLIKTIDIPLEIEVRQYLKTKLIGKHYSFQQEISSTNSFLADLPLSECHDGMVMAADKQTTGRGRMQRTWHSPKGTNLYFSVLLQPRRNLSDIPQLALVTAAAIVDALKTITPDIDAGIKWPNDILVNGKKLAGILCEMQAEADVIHKVILGIGLNVNITEKQFPKELQKQSTSLRMETGTSINRPQLMAELLNSMDKHYRKWLKDGLTHFLPTLKDRLLLVDKKIKVKNLDNFTEGVVQGLSNDGGLVLKTGNKNQTVYSGEIKI